MQQKNTRLLIIPLIALSIFIILIFGAGYAFYIANTSMNVANYHVSLPQQTSLVCTKTDCGVTVTPAQMATGSTSSSSAKATNTCYVNCTCSGTQGAKCNYNVSLLESLLTYIPSSGIGTNNEFTAKLNLTAASGCTAQNSSTTETQVNTIRDKIVANCSLTVPQSGSVSANVAVEFKLYNLNVDQASQAGKVYKYELVTEKELPSEYQRLNYIKGTGTQYIDTGIAPAANQVWRIQLKDNGSSAGRNYMGVNSSNRISIVTYGSASKVGVIATGITNLQTIAFDNNIHTYTLDLSNKKFYADDKTYGLSGTISSYPGTIKIFTDTAGSSISSMNCYYARIYSDNRLIMNLIPVKRVSDNVAGMYDLINGGFYESAGSSAFLAE